MIIAPLLLCTSIVMNTQQATQASLNRELDFWVGNWKCSGESYGANNQVTKTEGTNTITKSYDGHVTQENFRMKGLNGMSVSVYDAAAKLWRQTWVDDQGGYIALTGTYEDGKMTLRTIPRPDRPKAAARMIFSNIKADSFDWDWQTSRDAGTTWTPAWHLHYTRVKK